MLHVGKARYEYICNTCGLPIPKGTRYVSDVVYATTGPRRYIAKSKRCLACAIDDPTTPAETAGVLSEISRMIDEQATMVRT
jgi:hypothetical protein